MKITLGDQDFFTLLGWEDSSIFHILDCKDNMQLSLQYLASYIKEGNKEMQKKFIKYQYCAPYLEARILHFNGCGPKLKHCEINWHSKRHQRESYCNHKGLSIFDFFVSLFITAYCLSDFIKIFCLTMSNKYAHLLLESTWFRLFNFKYVCL